MTGKDNDTMNEYTTPELELIEFESEDIITTSILTGSDEMPIINIS